MGRGVPPHGRESPCRNGIHDTGPFSPASPHPRRRRDGLRHVLAAGALLAVGRLGATAAQSSPVGYASMNGGTTGGSASTVVTVTTSADLKTALNADTSQTIRVSAPIATAGLYNAGGP
jgi:pectate lyase